MSSVQELWGFSKPTRSYKGSEKWVLPSENIGMEFEFEHAANKTANIREPWRDYYEIVNDGSLRDQGCEFIFATPLFGEDLDSAIRLMCAIGTNYKFSMGERTSVHVHLDVRDMTAEQLHKLALIYCIVERSLFKFVGRDREKSNYCVPWYRSNVYHRNISTLLRTSNPDSIKNSIAGIQRYSALNYAALREHGSLEFRHMHGCIDYDKLVKWVNIIMSIKKAVRTIPVDKYGIMHHISSLGAETFIKTYFGTLLNPHVIQEDVWAGILEAQNLLVESEPLDFSPPVLKRQKRKVGTLVEKFRNNGSKKATQIVDDGLDGDEV